MPSPFAPYFKGQTVLWWPDPRVFSADYVVLHRRSVQQGDPDPRLLTYIRETWPLEHTVTLRGLPYVWIYRAPAADWTLSLEDRLGPIEHTGLWSYRITPKTLRNGETLTVTLYHRPPPSPAGEWVVRVQSESAHWDLRPHDIGVTLRYEESVPFIEKKMYRAPITVATVPTKVWIKIGLRREAEGAVQWLSFPEALTVPVIRE
jgi:hypothetical protein